MDQGNLSGLDPAFIRGMSQRRISRRQLFRYGGVGAGALGLSAFLAACGVSGTEGGQKAQAGTDWDKFWQQHAEPNGHLDFANWPYYIDRQNADPEHPSLALFTKDTGIEVNYRTVIQDNAAFFATIRPSLEQDKATGWDIVVITNGTELAKMLKYGWVVPLDQDAMTNFNQYAGDPVKDPAWDPGNKYTMAWQSGLTGIAYSPDAVDAIGHEVTSVNDLWDPALKGKVGMMVDISEIGSVGLLKLGIDPVTSTPADWRKAADELMAQRDAGLVRNYYDQSYVKALQDGETWVTQAWSGDIFISQSSGYPELKFIVPDEGAMFWTDNMMIPIHAENPRDAMTYMDYVYQPKVAAMIADWVWYITPVPSTQDIILNDFKDKAVGTSPLVFPTEQDQENFRDYYTYKSAEDETEWKSIFEPIVQS